MRHVRTCRHSQQLRRVSSFESPSLFPFLFFCISLFFVYVILYALVVVCITARVIRGVQCKGKHSKALELGHNVRAVLLDTQGPEIRTGMIKGGGNIQLTKGATIELTTDPVRLWNMIT